MNFDICPICRRFGNMDRHICPPSWQVRAEDWAEDEYSDIRADSAKDAACAFAEYDLADNSVYGEGNWTVFVRPEIGPQAWKSYTVHMEMQPVYSAKEDR